MDVDLFTFGNIFITVYIKLQTLFKIASIKRINVLYFISLA